MSSKATTAIYIDKSHPKANTNTCLVYIRVTFERANKYYATPYSLSVFDFEKIKSEKPRKEFKESSLQVQAYEKKAADIIKELPFFSFAEFEKRYRSNRTAKNTLKQAFEDYIRTLRNNDQISTAVSYECANNSLEKFSPGAKFIEVTPDFLKNYEKWMAGHGNSVTTVSMYLRSLRTLFNVAISENVISKEVYPFGKRRYEIPSGKNVKKAINLSVIGSIFNYPAAPGTTTEKARDYWIFMYLCNGMNMKDMSLLKYENIKGNSIHFERAKTARTKRQVEAIRVSLTSYVEKIILKHGNHDKDPSNFIFPVLTKGITATRERQLIQQITSVVITT